MDRTRCFVAIPLQPPASTAVADLVHGLRNDVRGVKWVAPENLHLTVKFLGDLDNRDLPEACRYMREACEDIEPFTIYFQGLGTFPKNRAPRVVWLGIEANTESLQLVHQRLEHSLESLGVRRENRAFRPHLTLGRPTSNFDGEALAHVLAAHGNQLLAEMDVNEVQLMASFLDRGGPTYTVIDDVALG